MSNPEWAILLRQNRVKDIGTPWNDLEREAIHTLKIPADAVRKGVLTIVALEKYLAKEPQKLEAKAAAKEAKAAAKEAKAAAKAEKEKSNG